MFFSSFTHQYENVTVFDFAAIGRSGIILSRIWIGNTVVLLSQSPSVESVNAVAQLIVYHVSIIFYGPDQRIQICRNMIEFFFLVLLCFFVFNTCNFFLNVLSQIYRRLNNGCISFKLIKPNTVNRFT